MRWSRSNESWSLRLFTVIAGLQPTGINSCAASSYSHVAIQGSSISFYSFARYTSLTFSRSTFFAKCAKRFDVNNKIMIHRPTLLFILGTIFTVSYIKSLGEFVISCIQFLSIGTGYLSFKHLSEIWHQGPVITLYNGSYF